MITPPRFVESILSALGATPEYRDLVIGDLAEEMEIRARYDGHRLARRWYMREALRSVPHLLGSGLRDAGFRGIGNLLSLVLTTWVLVSITVGPAMLIVLGVITPIWPEFLKIAQDGSRWPAVATISASVAAFVGGLFAAALHKAAPLRGALALGLTWAVVELILVAVGLTGWGAMWFPVVVPPLIVGAAIAGGLLYLRRQARSESPLDTSR